LNAGFLSYSIYNGALFFIPTLQQEYFNLYGPPLPVVLNDVIFAFHALAMTVIIIIQIFIYDVRFLFSSRALNSRPLRRSYAETTCRKEDKKCHTFAEWR
jgi:hypothetical protein